MPRPDEHRIDLHVHVMVGPSNAPARLPELLLLPQTKTLAPAAGLPSGNMTTPDIPLCAPAPVPDIDYLAWFHGLGKVREIAIGFDQNTEDRLGTGAPTVDSAGNAGNAG